VGEGAPAEDRGEAGPDTRLGGQLGHRFRDRTLLRQALTHSSYANEHPPEPDNAGLAFLGDAVLALVVADHLWRVAPAGGVGPLTVDRADIVSGANLARLAERLDLGALLRLGRGELRSGGQAKESVLATALEAVLAVVYLDGGLEAARDVVGRLVQW